jgi:putative ABC transport system substrate-binding protein
VKVRRKIARRNLVLALGAGALSPFALFGQQRDKTRRVGFLSHGPRPDQTSPNYSAFIRGLSELGYIEGKNLVIEMRFADNNAERLNKLAADLVRSNVEVIVTMSALSTRAAQHATGTIPIVMTTVADPVGSGFVKSLARPGGNVTGMSYMVLEIRAKQLEMLASAIPKLSRLAVLFNPDNPSNLEGIKRLEPATQKFSVSILALEARTIREIEDAFASMASKSVQALLLIEDPNIFQHRGLIGDLALKHRLPSIGSNEGWVQAGLLMSYGSNYQDIFRRAAIYVDKILKGTKPSDLPVEQPTRFDLVVNMKTAKALGIKLPDEIMVRAERFIE